MGQSQELADIELSLLATLKELLETESVTATARRIGSTQPNVSRTLTRLRAIFGDPLLVPVGRGLQRTERARELLPRLDSALASMRALLAPPAPLAPSKERRVFRIAATDYALTVLLHSWIRRLRAEAPGITVEVEAISAASIDALTNGEVDLAIASREPVVGLDQFVIRKVFEDRWVCVLRSGHPRARKRLTMAGYQALEHVMIAARVPAISPVQLALHRTGKTRQVVVRAPTFLAALALVSDTDLAATLPERLVRARAPKAITLPLPFPIDPIEVNLFWHPRRTTDPFHRWMREGIAAIDP